MGGKWVAELVMGGEQGWIISQRGNLLGKILENLPGKLSRPRGGGGNLLFSYRGTPKFIKILLIFTFPEMLQPL